MIPLYINAIAVVPYEYKNQLTEIPSHFTLLNAVREQANKLFRTLRSGDTEDKPNFHFVDVQNELLGWDLMHVNVGDDERLPRHAGEKGGRRMRVLQKTMIARRRA